MNAGFEWDEAKAKSNYRKHGVDFVTATSANPHHIGAASHKA